MVKRKFLRFFAVIAVMAFLAIGYFALSTDTAFADKPIPNGSSDDRSSHSEGKLKSTTSFNTFWD
ncbi:MAG: hypothetical protein QF467_03380 [SAR202 cluster bacterium]|jgi:hypothetical protein|nr:hypothetical protein [SAR202 cluster bacterium]|tara:strand:+ start:233 stop:427 length:195 start_codon:yes stop_codon:yes gene_type:complete